MAKIMIVIEDDASNAFKIYLDGDCDRVLRKDFSEIKDLTPAELWSSKMFSVCKNLLRISGALPKLDQQSEVAEASKG